MRDAHATQRRLIAAAAEEFSRCGIAAATTARIAAAAHSNKAQIWHYFGSKEGLFAAVMDDVVSRTSADVPFDVNDIPGWAGRLFDRYEREPAVARLAHWYRLEQSADRPLLRQLTATLTDEIDLIRDAQRQGKVSDRFPPGDLINLVVHLSLLYTLRFPEIGEVHGSRAHRRQVVTDAVAAVTGY